MSHVLIVDDEKNIRRTVEMILQDTYTVSTAESGREAFNILKEQPIDLVFLDLLMPEMNGIDVLKEIRTINPDTTVVMMSGHGTIENAVEAVKLGAYDFIEKPLTKEKLIIAAKNAL
ncbi:MAG TPA: response regulator, partial [bacterium]|nr:response regulator [bacterium]